VCVCACACVHFCRYIGPGIISQLILCTGIGMLLFQLILLTGRGMLLQINDTKQSEGVIYFLEFCLGT